ncbi:MAG: hypothetical protein ABI841_03820 [Chloroflexota bacterium]
MKPPETDESPATAATRSPSLERQLRHGVLAARTVAVSFRAAMESAERHLNVPDAERAEIKGRWRAWALETLEGYAAELETLVAGDAGAADGNAEALQRYRDELERAFEMVRTTRDDG